MIDERMDALLLRLDVPASPDPVFVERSLEELRPLVAAAAREDARPAAVCLASAPRSPRRGGRPLVAARPGRPDCGGRRPAPCARGCPAAPDRAARAAPGERPPDRRDRRASASNRPGCVVSPLEFVAAEEVTQLTRAPDGRTASLWIHDGTGYSLQLLDLDTGARRRFATDVPVDHVGCTRRLVERRALAGVRSGIRFDPGDPRRGHHHWRRAPGHAAGDGRGLSVVVARWLRRSRSPGSSTAGSGCG